MNAEKKDRNDLIYDIWKKAKKLADKKKNPTLRKGYKKIGEEFNLHYTVVGRIIRRKEAEVARSKSPA